MAEPNIRTRPYKAHNVKNKLRAIVYNGSTVVDDDVFESVTSVPGSQYTESEGHPFLSSKKKGMEDLGGEFFTTKRYVDYGGKVSWHYDHPTGPNSHIHYDYDGLCCAIAPDLTTGFNMDGNASYSNDVELDALGATAIARVAPTNPCSNLLQALLEIRQEGLPHVPGATSNWRNTTQAARNAGSEYLNAQFGWVPFVSDVTSFADTVTHAHSVIEQYKRGIGKPIHRRYEFPTVHQFSDDIWVGYFKKPYSILGNAFYGGDGSLYYQIEVIRKRWFSGCFTYYFPTELLGSKKLGDLAVLANRLGLEPTPEVLWQVAPWSWATDWVSNMGDVISNYSAFHSDGLVMRYGYMMEHSIIKKTYTLYNSSKSFSSLPVYSPVTFVIETKLRRKANPYGFGVSWDGLSPFQVSILAALGISRV